MTQTQPDAADASTDDKPNGCPDCGGDIYKDPQCVHGGPNDTTSGWACLECTWYTLDSTAPRSTRLDRPDPSIDENTIDLGSRGTITTAHDQFNAADNTYHDPDGCPNNDCDGTLEIYLHQRSPDAITSHHAPDTPEYTAVAEQCLDCDHRAP